MFLVITCKDLIEAKLWKHSECCHECHREGLYEFEPLVGPDGVVASLVYPEVKFSLCCAFVGREFTRDQIEQVIQSGYPTVLHIVKPKEKHDVDL
jgi:hypothetical protein